MKKNDIILTLAVVLYSYLFYSQAAGINFLIFNIVVIAGLWVMFPSAVRFLQWMASALGSLISAVGILLYGNNLSITANIISLSALSAFSLAGKSSLLLSLFHEAYTYLSSIPHMVTDSRKRVKARLDEGAPGMKRFLVGIGISIIVIVFFLLYRSANPVFDAYAAQIRLDFINWGRFWFTLFGLIWLYGLFYPRAFAVLLRLDSEKSNRLSETSLINDRLTSYFTVDQESRSGITLLAILNLLLFIVNSLDVNVFFIQKQLPAGLTYSDMVHQGVGTLIFSIVLAIAIILFYFRGRLDYFSKSRPVVILSLVWIAQNMLMIVLNFQRNNLYIAEYGLTYKRIGVYVYLVLALIGLVFTAVKIIGKRKNIYLFRANSWAFSAVLVISTLISWDSMIVDYNIRRTIENAKQLDSDYLLSLGYESYLPVIRLPNKYLPCASDTLVLGPQNLLELQDSSWQSKPRTTVLINECKLRALTAADFFRHEKQDFGYDWRTWCIRREGIRQQLDEYLERKDIKPILNSTSR